MNSTPFIARKSKRLHQQALDMIEQTIDKVKAMNDPSPELKWEDFYNKGIWEILDSNLVQGNIEIMGLSKDENYTSFVLKYPSYSILKSFQSDKSFVFIWSLKGRFVEIIRGKNLMEGDHAVMLNNRSISLRGDREDGYLYMIVSNSKNCLRPQAKDLNIIRKLIPNFEPNNLITSL